MSIRAGTSGSPEVLDRERFKEALAQSGNDLAKALKLMEGPKPPARRTKTEWTFDLEKIKQIGPPPPHLPEYKWKRPHHGQPYLVKRKPILAINLIIFLVVVLLIGILLSLGQAGRI